MLMQMLADFRLYRKKKGTNIFELLTKEDLDSISPGGFSFEIGEKVIPFDFDAQATSEENGVFSYASGYGPFFNDFELTDCFDEEYEALGIAREEISPEMLASVTHIQEFFVNFEIKSACGDNGIGDNTDPDAEFLIKLLNVKFEDRESGKVFAVDEKVLGEFNGKAVA